jgi:Ca2+-binding RTX toxin-like protein
MIEKLECRRMLASATIIASTKANGNELIVTGNNGMHNNIFVRYSSDSNYIIVRFDGKTKVFGAGNVQSMELIGGNKADSIIVDNNRVPFNIRTTLVAGRGADTLIGGDGADLFVGGSGADYMVGGYDDDTFVAGGGNDTIIGGAGTDIIFGSTGNDSIVGGGNSDIIYAGSGNDFIEGSNAGTNQIVCSGGDDFIKAQDGDTIWMGTGNDTIIGGVGSQGQIHAGDYPDLAKVLSIINPDPQRFRAAGNRPADEAPLV